MAVRKMLREELIGETPLIGEPLWILLLQVCLDLFGQ
jgi:hypothetical protein